VVAAVAARRASVGRTLMPREHGAYAELALPLIAVLFGGRPTAAAACLAVASCAAFVAHEPLLVVLGQRGARARREDGARSMRRLTALAVVAATLVAIGVALVPKTLPWLGVAAAIAACAGVFVARRSERTLGGELAAAAALTATALPVAAASGLDSARALALCAVFYATAIASTVEVRCVARRDEGIATRLSAWAVSSSLMTALAVEAPRFALAAVPSLAVVAGIAILRPGPQRLRQIGWTLAAASLVTATGVVVALRIG
jgi:hypothetical protein